MSQDAFFDVRVFYPNPSFKCSTNLATVYRRHEQAKKGLMDNESETLNGAC